MSITGYVPVESVTAGHRKDTITAPGDHPYGDYHAGDEVSPFDLTRAHLRAIAAERTTSGHVSAQAKMAQKELARNKANKANKRLVLDALVAAGL